MSLMEKAQELVDKAKHAAGRLTGDRDTRHNGKAEPPRAKGQHRISDAAEDAGDDRDPDS